MGCYAAGWRWWALALSIALIGTFNVRCTLEDSGDSPFFEDDTGGVDTTSDTDASDAGADAAADAVADADSATRDTQAAAPTMPARFNVQIAETAPEPVKIAAADVAELLQAMGRTTSLVELESGAARCVPGVGNIVFVGDGLGALPLTGDDVDDQTFAIAEERCGAEDRLGTTVRLAGGGLLGRQYAAYELLHAWGVRFFHPEETFIPDAPAWTTEPVVRQHTPDFRWRSVSLHLTHPLELGDAFRRCEEEFIPEGKRYIDWQIRNLSSRGQSGVCRGELATYGLERGFQPTGGIKPWGQQQGSSGVIDADDPRSDAEQVQEAIDAMMGRDIPPEYVSVNIQPTEFTEIDDVRVVDLLTFIANYFAENFPDVTLEGQLHGTAGPPTENFGVMYNLLPVVAPDNMGLRMHTLMFYDLFRPAPVYGNENFNYFYDLMTRHYRDRTITYFPEAAWWLTFDIGVPLYLPITIEARHRDIQGIAFMLEGKLEGHRVFGTGHEWGYWQNEYCSLRMSADVAYSYRDCLHDIAWPMGPAGSQIVEIVDELIATQERDFIYGDILAYLAGTDPETEAAASLGIEFHPLPPAPSEILRWSIDEVEDWEARIAGALRQMDRDYDDFLGRLNALEPEIAPEAAHLFREIRDGVEVTGLRAQHAWQVYGAIVAFRRAQLTFDTRSEERAQELLDAARATTERAQAVIERREEDYRYQPIERSIGGGPDGESDDNWTIYSYRYLNRPHRAFYFRRIDDLAEEAMTGAVAAGPVDAPDVILTTEQPLELTLIDESTETAPVEFGDGSTETLERGTVLSHFYDATGVWVVRVGDEAAPLIDFPVAVVEEELSTGRTGEIIEPDGVALIEPLLPAIVFGAIDASRVAVGFGSDDETDIPLGRWNRLDREPPDIDGSIVTQPARMFVPIISRGEVLTTVTVLDAVLDYDPGTESATIMGDLETEGMIRAVVDVGGFEEEGARRLAADLLGYTPETLPARLPFVATWAVVPPTD